MMDSFIIDDEEYDFSADFHRHQGQIEICIGETFNSSYECQCFFLSIEEARQLRDWLNKCV